MVRELARRPGDVKKLEASVVRTQEGKRRGWGSQWPDQAGPCRLEFRF